MTQLPELDLTVWHAPTICQTCQSPLAASAATTVVERRQIWDLPPQSLEVTEHCTLLSECAACGATTCIQLIKCALH